jgi:hypothetical protein
MSQTKTPITPIVPKKSPAEKKVLLGLLPFWSPLIPPMGISCLKSYLQSHGYQVKTIDANVEFQFREVYDNYFHCLEQYIPASKRGNFYNIGSDVLRNHMMAHLNHENEKEYINLVKIVVYQTFFCDIDDSRAAELNQIIAGFYTRLEKYVLQVLETEKPTVLGLSVYSATAAASLFAFKFARENYPHIKTVMGGGIFAGELSLGSPNFDLFLRKTPYIDKIIVGEGEKLFLKFLQDELPETQKVYTPKDIKGEVLALDSSHLPDFSDLDTLYYPTLAAYTSRSCPFQCTFCAEKIFWGKYRKKSAKHIAEELVRLSKKYNCQLYLMTDSLLNPIINELANELTDAGTSIYWDGYLRADQSVCDAENTFQWRRSGFYRARLGLESGSQKILEAMGKHITIMQIKEAVASLAHTGIKTTTYWLIGYPGETEEDFQQTLELIKELKDDIYEADCNPFGYFLTGQVESEKWRGKNKSILLYPESAKDMLMIQTWIMAGEPSREETYHRINRFVQHCNSLGIPNPYTLQEINEADERWKKLHRNAPPPLIEFIQGKNNKSRFIDENKKVKKIVPGQNMLADDGEWII